ncbi:hypothetical protein LOZ36_006830 [Ophidiomyces ophidiicola]|nr:hypothetical protein LOZ36_006830 [Ophidiomyces ophidiicola]
MLAPDFHLQDHPYSSDLLMESTLYHPASSLKVDEQMPFGAYTPFPSDSHPFLIPSLFPPDFSSLNLKRQQPYPDPSASPSVAASHPESLSSSSSVTTHSAVSAASSCIGSPHQDPWSDMNSGSILDQSATLSDQLYPQGYLSSGVDAEGFLSQEKLSHCFVDPSLIQPAQPPENYHFPVVSYAEDPQFCFTASPAFPGVSPIPSPTLTTQQSHQFQPTVPILPQHHQHQYQQQPQPQQYPHKRKAESSPVTSRYTLRPDVQPLTRRSSISSVRSRSSIHSPRSTNIEVDAESREKGRCPHPTCGKVFKDLKAHMLTHQSERPEKCPIVNCEYHLKGFARKYDKNRHTLTHYKGTMVCGFCPGSGSAAEKSFNRADVFKRHLTSVHGVDQSAPNGRKKSPPDGPAGKLSNYCQDATGKCSTCTATFASAQEFYEHLDDCVLRVVQQEEPSEAINMRRLTEIADDESVQQTMRRHMLTDASNDGNGTVGDIITTDVLPGTEHFKITSEQGLGKPNIMSRFLPPNSSGVSKPRHAASRRRNNRNNYPPSWGCPTNKMKMKRRLLCLYDGPRRLWKDEMMLDNEFEVRMKLPGGDGLGRDSYVTDLDVETIKRARGILNATDEEKGPWDPASANTGLLGPAAVPILGNSNDIVDEINIDELMS